MYRGGKKKTSSSPISIISRVFQVSWFPKVNPKGTKKRHSPPLPALRREGRFCSMDDDDDDGAYWRLSFRTEDRKSITGIPVPRFRSRGIAERQYKDRIVHNHERRLSRKKQLGRGTEDGEKLKHLKPVMEKYTFPIETPVYNSRKFSLMSTVDEGYASEGRVSSSEGRNSGKLNDENKFRAEPMCMISRKSRQRRIKPKSNSPKREFRVRVLEDMKKERTKSKKKETKEPMVDGTTVYDRFAEAKTSFDPQKDFRDSMVEMICEKRIRRPEELEDLLACYLTLNRDEYHDLIIMVFQQVWFELRGY